MSLFLCVCVSLDVYVINNLKQLEKEKLLIKLKAYK